MTANATATQFGNRSSKSISASKAAGTMKNGMLEIQLPKGVVVKTTRLEVKSAWSLEAII